MKKIISVVLCTATLFVEGANTVTNSNDSGGGSFREQVGLSNGTPDTVNFDPASFNITLATTVDITANYTIDGSVGANTVTIGGSDLSLGSTTATTFSNSGSGIFTIDSVISGGANSSIVKTGAETLYLTADNTYGGGTTLSAGQITLAVDASLGAGAISAVGGTTLDFEIAFNTDFTADNDIVIGAGGELTIRVNDAVNAGGAFLSGVISGSGSSIVKTGNRGLALNGANTFDNGLALQEGELLLGNNNCLGPGGSSILSMTTGTTLAFTNGITVDNAIEIDNSATVDFFALTGTGGLSGVISGTGLTIDVEFLNGALVLSGANTYSGSTLLTDGQITLGNDSALGTSNLTMAGGTTVRVLNGIDVDRAIAITSGTGDFSVTSGTGTLSGVISGGASSVDKIGSGNLLLSGNNTYGGTTTISAGILTASHANAFGSGALTVEDGAALGISDGITFSKNMAITGGSEAGIHSTSGTGTYSGVISGAGSSLDKTGSGTIVLTGANTYDSGTTITNGTLSIQNATSMGAGSVTILDDATLSVDAGLTVANNIAIDAASNGIVDVSSGTVTLSGVVSGATGTLEKTSAGELYLTGSNTYGGGTTLTGGQITIAESDSLGSGTLSMADNTTLGLDDNVIVSNAIAITGGVFTDVIIDVSGGASDVGILDGAISGDGLITKTGAGQLTLVGSNSFAGVMYLLEGTLSLENDLSLGTAPLAVADSTTLFVGAGNSIANTINIVGGASVTFDMDADPFTTEITGNITGSGSQITKTGTGSFTLAGNNTFSGGLTIEEGTVVLAHNNAAGTGTLTQETAAVTTLSLNSGITISNDLVLDNGSIASINIPSGTATLSGVVSGSASAINKQGSGVLVFSGTNTFAGDLSVVAGTCKVNGVYAGDIGVTSGSLLNGNGTVNGLVTVNSGGALTPGNSIGTITLDDLTLDAGSTTNIEFSPTESSFIDVTNTANVAGTLYLTPQAGTYEETGSYEILSADTLNGTFDTITGTGIDRFTFEINPVGNSLFLEYLYEGPNIPTAALSGNDETFAEYINNYAPHSMEINALDFLSGEAQLHALRSISPARNAFGTFVTQQTMFSFNHILNDYLGTRRYLSSKKSSKELADLLSPHSYELLADEEERDLFLQTSSKDFSQVSLWASGFVDFAHQDGESENVPFDFISEGVLVGVNYSKSTRPVLGLAVGYAHSQMNEYEKMGMADISYYIASVYLEQHWECLYVQLAFWGVFNQISNQRQIIYADIDTKAYGTFNGWQVAPHAELGACFDLKVTEMEPYVSFDYVYNWQGSMQEKGAGNLNMFQKAQESSMLQSQVGMKLYQLLELKSCNMGFKEGFSYINRTPYNTGNVTTAIFGATEFVTLVSFTDAQNLGAVNAVYLIEFGEKRDFVFSLGYEGQFGSQYTFNELLLSLSKNF